MSLLAPRGNTQLLRTRQPERTHQIERAAAREIEAGVMPKLLVGRSSMGDHV